VVILADDIGYSDMGMFGSEIKTPDMDNLAKAGVRFTNFYTHAAEDLKMDTFRVTLIYGWHKLIEGMNRLRQNKKYRTKKEIPQAPKWRLSSLKLKTILSAQFA
jgi:hypothetical protein